VVAPDVIRQVSGQRGGEEREDADADEIDEHLWGANS
jgi:hypothetical protein